MNIIVYTGITVLIVGVVVGVFLPLRPYLKISISSCIFSTAFTILLIHYIEKFNMTMLQENVFCTSCDSIVRFEKCNHTLTNISSSMSTYIQETINTINTLVLVIMVFMFLGVFFLFKAKE